jgi:hypothetical protein
MEVSCAATNVTVVAKVPGKLPQLPLERVAWSRWTTTVARFTPEPLSVAIPNTTDTDNVVTYPAVTVGAGTVGGVVSTRTIPLTALSVPTQLSAKVGVSVYRH